MATLFQQSSKTYDDAVKEIADSAGASGDSEMQTRAGRALAAAFEEWNTAFPWTYLLTDYTAIAVVAPVTVSACSWSAGGTAITVTGNVATGVIHEDLIAANAGLRPLTRVLSVQTGGGNTTINITGAALADSGVGGETLTFIRSDYDLPSNFKAMYTVRLASNQRKLEPVDQRLYDYYRPGNETSTPVAYSLFRRGGSGVVTSSAAGSGHIRLLPPPSSADTLLMRYYRRMVIPSVAASADALDIPQDYEYGVLSLAKAMFLSEKGGYPDRVNYWQSYASERLRRAIADDQRHPDNQLAFQPGYVATYQSWNPNNTVFYLDET